MAWDSSRPVPWNRLLKDWAIYAGIMIVVFLVVFRDDVSAGTFIGLVSSLPIYLLFGAVLAKFGYVRKTVKQMRAETVAKPRSSETTTAASPGRPKPPPTRRTSSGPSNRRPAGKRKR